MPPPVVTPDMASTARKHTVVESFISLMNHLGVPVSEKTEVIENQREDPSELPTFTLKSPSVKGEVPARFAYVQSGSKLILTHSYQVRVKKSRYHAQIDVETGRVVKLMDWVSDNISQNASKSPSTSEKEAAESKLIPASSKDEAKVHLTPDPPTPEQPAETSFSKSFPGTYNVLPIGINDPRFGSPRMIRAKDVLNKYASPLGWHKENGKPTYTDTRGNNVYVQINKEGTDSWVNKPRPQGGPKLIFNQTADFTMEPGNYSEAGAVQLFYTINMIHDILYPYGFDEQAGNFQMHNFQKGGDSNDTVIAQAQDGSGENNASFETPPDGEK
jgi:hypothetical protein